MSVERDRLVEALERSTAAMEEMRRHMCGDGGVWVYVSHMEAEAALELVRPGEGLHAALVRIAHERDTAQATVEGFRLAAGLPKGGER